MTSILDGVKSSGSSSHSSLSFVDNAVVSPFTNDDNEDELELRSSLMFASSQTAALLTASPSVTIVGKQLYWIELN